MTKFMIAMLAMAMFGLGLSVGTLYGMSITS